MKPAFVVGLAVACLLLSTPAMALRFVQGQVILDKLDDYALCQDRDYSGDWCHDALKRWVDAHPADAFAAGKMTRKIMNPGSSIPFFTQAFDQKAGDCKDADVKLGVVGAMGLPADNTAIIQQAKKIGLEICFDDMKADLVSALDGNGNVFTNLCPDLAAKGVLSGLKLERCKAGKQ